MYICFILVSMWCLGSGAPMNEDVVFYNPKTHHPFRVVSIENNFSGEKINDDETLKSSGIIRRIAYRSNGCTCQELTCGCCLGMQISQFNFSREGCMNFTYDPYGFAINMDMIMNGNRIFSNSVSAKNPPPLCLPISIPNVSFSLEGCARLFDLYTPGQNLHMCFDFEARVQKATVLVLHFDCMQMGSDGFAVGKPGMEIGISSTTDNQIDSEVYNEVTEIKYQKND